MKSDAASPYRNAQARCCLRARPATLEQAGVEAARSESELLLAAALGVDRARLLTGCFLASTTAPSPASMRFVARRAAREPLAYIVGHKEFYSLEFEVNRHVLIPRPETELMVATALEAVGATGPAQRSWISAPARARSRSRSHVNAPGGGSMATDISSAPLAVARRNAQRLGCAATDRIRRRRRLCRATLFASDKFDLIVSNPPYIPAGELARLEPEVARFEPAIGVSGRQGRVGILSADCAGSWCASHRRRRSDGRGGNRAGRSRSACSTRGAVTWLRCCGICPGTSASCAPAWQPDLHERSKWTRSLFMAVCRFAAR